MPLSDEDAVALVAELEKAKRELEREKETIRRKTEAMQAKLEREERELERSKWTKELLKREDEAELEWLQSETVEIPMFPLLEGPEQSAPTTVALAAEAPAAEVMTDTRAFPDTAAPDASVERAASNSNSSNSSKSSSNGSNNNGSSSSNDTTSNYGPWWDITCVVALLRPFDPGKGYQRDVRRGKAVLGVDLPFDRGKSWGRMQHGG